MFREKALQVVETEDRWYALGATFFRMVVDGSVRYVLRHEGTQDVWSLIGYRATARLTQKLSRAYSQVTSLQ